MISDDFRCFPMFLAVFRCFQLGCNYYRIAPCAMHNHPLCATFVELPLWSVAGSGCFGWISTWTKLDHVGNTGGHWETMSSSFSISFESSKSVYAFYIVFSPWYNWWICKISFLQIWYFLFRGRVYRQSLNSWWIFYPQLRFLLGYDEWRSCCLRVRRFASSTWKVND